MIWGIPGQVQGDPESAESYPSLSLSAMESGLDPSAVSPRLILLRSGIIPPQITEGVNRHERQGRAIG